MKVTFQIEGAAPVIMECNAGDNLLELARRGNVAIDAPCSGVGVMTDKPDLKYRVSEESIKSLVETQKKILRACAPYVKRGGVLVYSTCSILPEENEKQIEAFLMDHPEFKRDEKADWVPEALKERMTGGMLSLLPVRDGVEGFFIARMRRVDV